MHEGNDARGEGAMLGDMILQDRQGDEVGEQLCQPARDHDFARLAI